MCHIPSNLSKNTRFFFPPQMKKSKRLDAVQPVGDHRGQLQFQSPAYQSQSGSRDHRMGLCTGGLLHVWDGRVRSQHPAAHLSTEAKVVLLKPSRTGEEPRRTSSVCSNHWWVKAPGVRGLSSSLVGWKPVQGSSTCASTQPISR